MIQKILKGFFWTILVWSVVVLVAVFEMGAWPVTAVGWACTLTVVPVTFLIVQLVGEAVVEGVRQSSLVRGVQSWLEERCSPGAMSLIRMGVLLTVLLCVFSLFLVLYIYDVSMAEMIPSQLKAFVDRHFA